MSETITISVDAMGGDNGPRIVLHGARLALRERGNIEFLFHGREEILAPLMEEFEELKGVSSIHHSDIVIGMDENQAPLLGWGAILPPCGRLCNRSRMARQMLQFPEAIPGR